ncbi:MAG: hypothetical protein XD78_1779 [Desulfotomaculum sp. 46_296]|nr:MAG: hypothetical protein XD78_1779 [Desulfotomaculum sp. 46_296]HAU32380.1 hypothetical protein [Desulfotomaculum sp.]
MKSPFCQALINGDLQIPCNKPPVEQIINSHVEPKIDRIIVISEKIIVRGHVEINIEYVANVCDNSQPVHFVHFLVFFDCFIHYPCLKPGSDVKVCPEIEYSEFILIDDKTFSKFVVVKISADVKQELASDFRKNPFIRNFSPQIRNCNPVNIHCPIISSYYYKKND